MLSSYILASTDVTSRIELLGNPYIDLYKTGEKIYARNIWDMQVFDGKLFIGAGNSNNLHPAPNAGRVPVYSYDPKNNKFSNEYTVAEEQIDRFRVIGDKLYIPGHDATQKWDFGNFYTRTKQGEWAKYRTIPKALHVYDIVSFKNELFVALGLYNISAVGASTTQGKIWSVDQLGASYSRVYSFLKVDRFLYACKSFTSNWYRKKHWSKKQRKGYFSIGEYEGVFFTPRFDLVPRVMFPDTYLEYKKTKKIIRTEFFEDKSIYIGAYKHNNGHQSNPFGVYVAESLKKGKVSIKKISIGDGYVPWDLMIRGEQIYVLCYDSIDMVVKVISIDVKNNYKTKELFHFKSIAFARSFELLYGYFYFGIGSEIMDGKNWSQSELLEETGNILRVKSMIGSK